MTVQAQVEGLNPEKDALRKLSMMGPGLGRGM